MKFLRRNRVFRGAVVSNFHDISRSEGRRGERASEYVTIVAPTGEDRQCDGHHVEHFPRFQTSPLAGHSYPPNGLMIAEI